jgi:DNA transposition AAA+ family ATPase
MTAATDTFGFIPTKAYARFVEFAQACAESRYIGVCHGRPGVGKTFSARQFSGWGAVEDYTLRKKLTEEITAADRPRLAACQAVFYTATVANTPKMVQQGLVYKIYDLGNLRLRLTERGDNIEQMARAQYHCPLVIVDEADRLSLQSYEELRDLYDRYGFGLVLLGMPGIEKRLARYPQFYSRIGFKHEFQPLSKVEMRFIFEQHWQTLGFAFDSGTFLDVEAMNAAIRITQGNFRLIERLFSQIRRVLEINNVDRITLEVVEAARNCLVIGKP